MTCKIQLEKFEGPLDLLLYLIRKDEVDIYDIPIAQVTDQYIQYIDMMKDLSQQWAEGHYTAAFRSFLKNEMYPLNASFLERSKAREEKGMP